MRKQEKITEGDNTDFSSLTTESKSYINSLQMTNNIYTMKPLQKSKPVPIKILSL